MAGIWNKDRQEARLPREVGSPSSVYIEHTFDILTEWTKKLRELRLLQDAPLYADPDRRGE